MPAHEIAIDAVVDAAELAEASTLYTTVFGYDSGLSLNAKLLAAISANGGVTVGARRDGELVGFAYGFPGWREGNLYLYSQAAVVATDLQGQGLGRQLKLAQREAALARGMTVMRWAFDPLLSRNAHFNLDVLGARGIAVVPDFYGTGSSNRMIVVWDLTSPVGGLAVDDREDDLRRVELPAHVADVTPEIRARVYGELDSLLEDGWEVVSCTRISPTTSAYTLHPGPGAAGGTRRTA